MKKIHLLGVIGVVVAVMALCAGCTTDVGVQGDEDAEWFLEYYRNVTVWSMSPGWSRFTLAVNQNPEEGGTVMVNNGQSEWNSYGVLVGGHYVVGYYVDGGTAIPITAEAASGYTFTDWKITSGSGTIANAGNASTTVMVFSTVTVTANFTQQAGGGATGGGGGDNGGGTTPPPGGDNGGGTTPPTAGSLVCADGEAWVACDSEGYCDGIVFKSNGTAFFVWDEGDGNWYYDDEDWDLLEYSASGNQLTLTVKDVWSYIITVTYSVSGNQLTLWGDGDTSTYTKTSGVNPIPYPALYKSVAKERSPRHLWAR